MAMLNNQKVYSLLYNQQYEITMNWRWGEQSQKNEGFNSTFMVIKWEISDKP